MNKRIWVKNFHVPIQLLFWGSMMMFYIQDLLVWSSSALSLFANWLLFLVFESVPYMYSCFNSFSSSKNFTKKFALSFIYLICALSLPQFSLALVLCASVRGFLLLNLSWRSSPRFFFDFKEEESISLSSSSSYLCLFFCFIQKQK